MGGSDKWVYAFGGGGTEGDAAMRNLLGGKGANLAEMSGLGLPVPPGFTLTTEVCTAYYDHDKNYPDGLSEQVETALKEYIDPYLEKDLVSAKAVKNIAVDGGKVTVEVVLGYPAKGYRDTLAAKLKEKVSAIDRRSLSLVTTG